jgi:hypothetical protein
MSILNRPSDGLLTVLLAVRRALAVFGPMDEQTLTSLCAPPAVIADPQQLRHTITRWKQIGVLEEQDRQLTLNSSVASVELDDMASLRYALLGFVLSRKNNGWVSGGSDDSPTGDWTRAAAWVLTQDLYRFPKNYNGAEELENEQRVEPRVFQNDTRWSGFVEWAMFLGLGWQTKGGPIFEPSFAVAAALPTVFRNAREQPFSEFLTGLASILPILDTGTYASTVHVQVGRPWRIPSGDQVSPCLSAALERLDVDGTIRLESRSDAPQVWLLGRGGRERRKVSHVVRLGVRDDA